MDCVDESAVNAELTPVLDRLTDRRRRVLALLSAEAPLAERDLAARVAAREAPAAVPGDADAETVESVRVELRQVDLPVLADLALVERTDACLDVCDHPVYEDNRFQRLLDAEADLEELVDCLADERRRRVLALLVDRQAPVAREDLAADLAPDATALDDCRVELHHRHLPKLDARSLLKYDPDTGRVDPTLSGNDAEWVERLTGA
jgi:hypothetical protein